MAKNWGRWLLFGGALLLALVGQFYFARKPDYLWDGLVFYLVAAILFVLAARSPRPRPAGQRAMRRSNRVTVLRRVMSGAGLACGLLAALFVAQPHDNYWPIFWLWVAGAALYLLGFARYPAWSWQTRGREPPETAAAAASAVQVQPVMPAPLALVAAGGGLAAGSAGGGTAVYNLPAGGEAKARSHPASRAFASLLRSPWLEWIIVTCVIVGALVLRAWHVDTIPWTLSGDEGNFGLWAREVLRGQTNNMFSTGHLSMPSMYIFFQALWLKLAGDNTVGLRLPWAVMGTLSVLGTYLLVRRLFDRWLALLAAAMLATYHFHIHYSRLGINNISDPFFVVWSLYFLVLAWQERRRWAWAAAGMTTGLAFYSYTGSRLVPVIMLALLAWAVIIQRDFLRDHTGDLLAMLGGFLVVVGPMAVIAFQHPDDFNARINQVGIFQSGWLNREIQVTGRSQLSILAEQFRRAFLAFNYYLDRTDFYRPSIPLMDFAAGIFFVLGGILALTRIFPGADHPEPGDPQPGDPRLLAGWRYAVFVIWFVLAVTVGSALTESPPSSQRMVASTVPAAFFVALAVWELTKILRGLLGWHESTRRAAAAVLVAVLAVISLRFYFVTYQQTWVYGSFNAEVATKIGYYLRDMERSAPPGKQVHEYFFGAPRMYADFGSTPFLAPGVQFHDVTERLQAPLNVASMPAAPDAAAPLAFVFLPERRAELSLVQEAYPNGQIQEVHRMDDSRRTLLFIAYRVN